MTQTMTSVLLLILTAGCASRAPESSALSGDARSSDGIPIRYETRGSGQPAIMLVHGWTNSRAIWGEHPRTLARTHRVVALDLPGHGASGADRAQWTMDAFGEDVVAVADQLELDRVVLVGFSMGAAVVLEAAERMPGRAIGVVLVDAFHDPEAVPPAGAVDQMLAQFRTSWGDTAFLRAFAFTPETPDSLVQHLAQTSPAQPREEWFPIARALFEWARTDFKPTLQGITVPVAAINATQQPTRVEAIRRYAPSFTLDTLQGVGHAGILLQRTADFDARLLAIVDRFAAAERSPN
jgi:pimeloyl-ACP methyl ester carboxylesterase